MNINRDYLLILDVKSGNLTVPTMYFINTDRGTSNIYLQLIVKNTDIKVSPLENATNYKVKANIVKSGGIIKFIEGVLVNKEDAIYEFNLPVDCINLSGAYRIEFEVSADVGEKQESITSFSTKYYVKRSILAEINEEIEDGDDYPLIVKLLAKIEELEKDSETRWIAENERIANEELRVQAESERLARYTLAEEKEAQRVIDEEARINAENERLAKEEERIAKEIDRVAKETERLNEEEIRKGSEITRVLNETTRVTNEEARVEAENIRLPKYLEAEEKEQARLIAEEERIANEELRVSNENDRKTAEAIRDSKEADRLNSEVFRLTNEVNRLENEKLRTNNEATRINSELTRVDNERNRVVAEKSRANSEDIRKTNENNRKIYEANREKAEQLRESNEVIRQEGYELMREQINNIEISGGYTHPSTHPASMITGLSDVAISGSYNDLTNKPTIPTNLSDFNNDSDFVTKSYVDGKFEDIPSGGNESTPEETLDKLLEYDLVEGVLMLNDGTYLCDENGKLFKL